MEIINLRVQVNHLPVQKPIQLDFPAHPLIEIRQIARPLIPIPFRLLAIRRDKILQLIHPDRRTPARQKQQSIRGIRRRPIPRSIRLLRAHQKIRPLRIPILTAKIFAPARRPDFLQAEQRIMRAIHFKNLRQMIPKPAQPDFNLISARTGLM